MNGLKLNIEVTADTHNDLAEALQSLLDNIGQGITERKSATDTWWSSYAIEGKEIL
jgi:hypothetical protein